ncbi:MAG: hypothetical protein A3K83_06135 [Omnitrophica WOR_2 bacterium RBG_13_44_8b]|nr:MAG: hypothetical protein A3K83_06135 [Omnitrophica WOR_2 bacterium RBG_13_44_8b]
MIRALKIFYILLALVMATGCVMDTRLQKQFLDIGQIKDAYEVASTSGLSLPAAEKLTYDIKWIGIPIGALITSIKGIEKINERDTYVFEAVFKTNDFCSKIYPVDDRFVSYMDKELLYTIRHEVYRREGKYKKDAVTEFDQVNGKAHFRNLLDNTDKVFDIPRGVHDFLSAYYYLRLLSLNLGDKLRYAVSNNEKIYQVILFAKSRTHLNLGALGKKPALLIQPYALQQGEQIREGSARGYYSYEGERMLLSAVITAPVFTRVSVQLKKVEEK